MNMRSFGQDELIGQIEGLINDITGGESGIIINLDDVEFTEGSRSSIGSSTLAVSCLFLNEERKICGDMYRSGSGGFFEFICGMSIDEIGRRGLDEILYALRHDRWSVVEKIRPQKKNRINILAPLRMAFQQKGA